MLPADPAATESFSFGATIEAGIVLAVAAAVVVVDELSGFGVLMAVADSYNEPTMSGQQRALQAASEVRRENSLLRRQQTRCFPDPSFRSPSNHRLMDSVFKLFTHSLIHPLAR